MQDDYDDYNGMRFVVKKADERAPANTERLYNALRRAVNEQCVTNERNENSTSNMMRLSQSDMMGMKK